MSKLDEVKAGIAELNKEHDKKIAELMATLEEPEEEPEYKRWRAEKGEWYHYLDDNRSIMSLPEGDLLADGYRYSIDNYFKTSKEARVYKDKLIAYQTIKDDTKGFEPNWKDEEQEKWYGSYNEREGLNCDFTYAARSLGEISFANKEDICDSLEKHEAEWKLLLGVEDE